MGDCCAVDPRSAPVYSNTYRLATAGALTKVPQRTALGVPEFGSAGVYLAALAIPAVVLSALVLFGVIKFD